MRAEIPVVQRWSRGQELPIKDVDFTDPRVLIKDINVLVSDADKFFTLLCRDVLISRGLEEARAEQGVKSVLERCNPGNYEKVTSEMAGLLKLHGGKASQEEVRHFRGLLERKRHDYQSLLPVADIVARVHPWTFALCDALAPIPFQKRIIRTTAPVEWAATLNEFFKLPAPDKFVRPEIRPGWDSLFTNPGKEVATSVHRSKVVCVVHSIELLQRSLEACNGVTIVVSPKLVDDPARAREVIDDCRRRCFGNGSYQPSIRLIAPDSTWNEQEAEAAA